MPKESWKKQMNIRMYWKARTVKYIKSLTDSVKENVRLFMLIEKLSQLGDLTLFFS